MSALANIREALGVLCEPDGVHELRIPKLARQREGAAGYFDSLDAMSEAAAGFSGKADGVYLTLNPVEPALLARAVNRVKPGQKPTSSDRDVLRRRWLPLDFDPVRPSGISSSDAEKARAEKKMREVFASLRRVGWPDPVVLDSGNGWHLLYRVDLPNDQASHDLVHGAIAALAAQHNDARVTIDTTVANAARIWKVPGTMACKGDSTIDRPHRISALRYVPAAVEPVDPALVAAQAARLPQPDPTTVGALGRVGRVGQFDLDGFVRKHLRVRSEGPWQGGHIWRVDCPWNPDHEDDAFVARMPSGAVAARCHHAGCSDKNWHHLREMFEPKSLGVVREAIRAAGYPRDADPGSVEVPSQVADLIQRLEVFRTLGEEVFTDVLPLPLHAFPRRVRNYVVEIMATLPCPDGFAANAALCVLGSAIGRRVSLRLTSTWRETPIFYCCIVGDTGQKKTPAMRAMMQPLIDLQKKLQADWKIDLAEWQARKERYDKARKAGGDPEPPGERPPEPHLYSTNSTMEKLAEMLEWDAVLLFKDEMVSWVLSHNMYRGGQGTDRQDMLSLWSRAELKVDRKGSTEAGNQRPSSLIVMNPHMCVLGGCPPEMLSRLADEAGRQDGFIDRILWAWPQPIRDRFDPVRVDPMVYRSFAGLVEQLALAGRDSQSPVELLPDPEAMRLWTAWYNANAELTARATPLRRGAYAKLTAQAARIAVALHMAEFPGAADRDRVGPTTMQHALELAEYFRSHGNRVMDYFSGFANRPSTLEERVYQVAWRNGGEPVDLETFMRELKTVPQTVLCAVLARLTEHGRLSVSWGESHRGGGRPVVQMQWEPVRGARGEPVAAVLDVRALCAEANVRWVSADGEIEEPPVSADEEVLSV